ncbi:MAG: type II secretion system secretin GspD [Hyphomicrobiales bacterium]
MAVAIAGCNARLDGLESNLPGPGNFDLGAKKPKTIPRNETEAGPKAQRGSYQIFPGQPTLRDGGTLPAPGVTEEGGKFSINIDGADMAQAAKLILGDSLGLNYIVDPRVQGTITLSSSRPLSGREVLDAFEAALRLNGAVLVHSDGLVKVVASQEVIDGEMGAADFGTAGGAASPGYGVSVVPLRYISVINMLELLDSFIARSGTVRASNAGSMILLRGTAAERQALVDVVLSFDVDWMRSQTAAIAILANSTPDDMVAQLEAVFADDTAASGANKARFIPLERLNGVVIIANSSAKVRRALSWVGRLDKSNTNETGYYVYAVQNGSAVEFAKILNSTFLEKSGAADKISQVAPEQEKFEQSTTPTPPEGQPDDTGQGQGNERGKSDLQPPTTKPEDSTAAIPETDLSSGIRITPNTANNTLVIRATPREYRKILAMLRRIDSPAIQVLINATIAEVSLNDKLRYGVQAYFKSDDVSGGVFTGNSLVLKPSFPGLNFFLGKTSDPRLVLDALEAITRVRVVSSPSVAVLENQSATIKVGDQVPIKTGETVGQTTTETFEYRDTGVILKVKPRVGANGMVTMEIAQELSSVVAGVAAGGRAGTRSTNPTISQRTVSSTVSVQSAQTVVLGGLISGQESREKDSVPGINKIPILGDLIGRTDNSATRNELIIFITPQIIRNVEDASDVSQELRAKMKSFNWN